MLGLTGDVQHPGRCRLPTASLKPASPQGRSRQGLNHITCVFLQPRVAVLIGPSQEHQNSGHVSRSDPASADFSGQETHFAASPKLDRVFADRGTTYPSPWMCTLGGIAARGREVVSSTGVQPRCAAQDGLFAEKCVQRRLACSVGVSPTGAEVRSPVAWIASVEETKPMKPIDKAIFGMVSESPGRNGSEPTGGLVRK